MVNTATSNGEMVRFVKGQTCPVCGGSDDDKRGEGRRCFGFINAAKGWIHCSREEHAGKTRFHHESKTYSHRLKGPCACGEEHAPGELAPVASKGRKGTLDQVYKYRNLEGKVIFEVVRFKNPKGFAQRRPGKDARGKPLWGLGTVKPVLYNLPALIAADPSALVFICEGEKDVDRLGTLGLLATTSPMGAGKWRDHYSEVLKGHPVIIIPDNDSDGRQHAQQVAQSLQGKAASVKVVELPGLSEKGDASDFLTTGGTVEQIAELARKTPEWKPKVVAAGDASTNNGHDDLDARLAKILRTDTGNGERMATRFGERIRYCHPWSKWLHYDGRRWKVDDDASVRRLAKRTARNILGEAKTIDDDDARKKHAGWAIESESGARLNSMMNEAAAEMGIPILPDGMDRDPWLLNCLNGTVDLRTGELRPHRQDDLITRLAPVEFNPLAKCSRWITILDEIFNRHTQLIRFVCRLFGMALTGDTSEQVLPIFYGAGANGKTTLLTALLEILGDDYAMMAPPGLLVMRRGDPHPTERALLHGKRLIVDMESAEGARLNEAWVKQLTGSDQITARRMREDFWKFSPTHKIVMGTNHKPEIRETKNAIWRRVKLVPFEVAIPEEKQIKDLPKRLRAEYPGILAWCVRGCVDWQQNGLNPPQEVTDATAEYRKEQDLLTGFLATECKVNLELKGSLKAKASLLYERYRRWTGDDAITQRAFGAAMSERGFERFQNCVTWYRGVGLLSDDSIQD